MHQRHHAHTLSHLGALRITKPSTIMFLGDGRKPEKSKETNTTPGEHSKLHIDSSSGSNWPVLAILKMSERTSMASDGSQYSYCKTTNKQTKKGQSSSILLILHLGKVLSQDRSSTCSYTGFRPCCS